MPITSKRNNEVVTFTRDIQVTGKLGQVHVQFPATDIEFLNDFQQVYFLP